MRHVFAGLLLILLAGCSEGPEGAAQEAENREGSAQGVATWQNETFDGRFTGYSVFPVMAGAVEDTERSVDIPPGAALFRLELTEHRGHAEYYVAAPDCPYDNVADCRSEEGFIAESGYAVFETRDPMPGTWRFELAGSGGAVPPASVQEIGYTMLAVLQLTGEPVLWEPPAAK